MFKERRKQFLINRPLQLRYMTYFSITLIVVSSVVVSSLYFGIWGEILNAFSNEKIRDQLLIATRLTEYQAARVGEEASPSIMNMFKQSEKLSQRQREVFKDILQETNKNIIKKLFFLLFLIAWASIYLSHKIAGPLYRFHQSLSEVKEGDLKTRIHLRHRDEGQFIAKEFNDTVETFDHSYARMKNILTRNKDNPEQLKKRLKEELDKFQTDVEN